VVRHKIAFEKIWTCLFTQFTTFKPVFHLISLTEGQWILSVQFCVLVISASWSRWVSHFCLMFGKPPGRWAVEVGFIVRSSFLPDSTIQLIPVRLNWVPQVSSWYLWCRLSEVSLVGSINVDSRGNRRSSQILQLVPAYCDLESIPCFQSRTFHSVFDYRPNFLARINFICSSWSFSSSYYCTRRISDFKFHSKSTPFNL
jgi:hypothetical protein